VIKITLITPTRNRVKDLKNFFESIKATASDPGSIEILFFVDEDDEATLPIIWPYEEEYKAFNVRFHVGKRSDHFSKDYYNFLARQARGRWVMAVNDDSIFVTPGWDVTVCAKMQAAAEAVGDDILLGIVQDGMIRKGAEKEHPTMSCWLLSSKQYVDLTGGLLLEEIYTWGGDYWLGRTFTKVQNGARKVFILDVLIEHNSHHANPRRGPDQQLPQPESFAHFQRIEAAHPCAFGEDAAQKKADVINDFIMLLHTPRPAGTS
jgi:hypothetical protein